LSKALQKENTSIAQCAKTASGIIQEFESKRNEEAWNEKWEEVKKISKDCGINMPTASTSEKEAEASEVL